MQIRQADGFSGDAIDHRPTWGTSRLGALAGRILKSRAWGPRSLDALAGRILKFRVVLERTRLFALHLEKP